MSDWQPISTAPADGRWILLCGGEVEDQRHWDEEIARRPVVARWATEPLTGWFVADFDSGYGLGIYYEDPTMWMEIPDAGEPMTT